MDILIYIYINGTKALHTLCPTNLYARIWGLKFHTIRQESIDPEAEMVNLLFLKTCMPIKNTPTFPKGLLNQE